MYKHHARMIATGEELEDIKKQIEQMDKSHHIEILKILHKLIIIIIILSYILFDLNKIYYYF